MTPDTIAIIAVGVALGSLIVLMFRMTHKRLDSLDQRMASITQRMDQRLDGFEASFSALERRQARLEGLTEEIRDMLSRIPLVN